MTDFLTEPAFEIGRRLEIRGSSAWLVVLRPAEEGDTLPNFVADLSAVLDQPVRVVRISGSSFEKLRGDLRESAGDPVLIPDLDGADAERWRALDVNRSAWLREGAVVLWLSAAGVTNLCSHRFAFLLGIRVAIVIRDGTTRGEWSLFVGRIPLPSKPA